MTDLSCADDLVLCGELEKDLREMTRHFAEGCKGKRLKMNTAYAKGTEGGSLCEFSEDGS